MFLPTREIYNNHYKEDLTSAMQRHSPAGNLVDHGQPSPERQHTSNSRDLELGHQVTPANSHWRFGSLMFPTWSPLNF
jgi:hypothetical protein